MEIEFGEEKTIEFLNKQKNRGVLMPARRKSKNLFLMDGTSVGRIKCTHANWAALHIKYLEQNLINVNNGKILNKVVFTFYLGHLMKM